jgi:ABC-type multidrug transport system fused ATPase/permease subunit
VKYRPDLDNVLKSISLEIEGGCKVGVVGRTGAGKTTLISSIYRSFDSYSGQIYIDGKAINQVDLKELRNAMTIIP